MTIFHPRASLAYARYFFMVKHSRAKIILDLGMFDCLVVLVFENDEVENSKKYVRRVGGSLEGSL